MKNEIILYRPDELAEHMEVRIDEEENWHRKWFSQNLRQPLNMAPLTVKRGQFT